MRTPISSTIPSLSAQRGAVALLIVLLLMLAMAIITITTSRTNVVEQKIGNNYTRALFIQQAGEGFISDVVTWAATNSIPWANNADSEVDCPNDGCANLVIATDPENNGVVYDFSVQFFRPVDAAGNPFDNGSDPTFQGYRHVIISALQSNNNSSTREDVWIRQGGFLSTVNGLPAPFIINGGMTNNTGNPTLYPQWTDYDGDGKRDVNEWVDTNKNGVVDPGEWKDSNGNGLIDAGQWTDTNNNGLVDKNLGEWTPSADTNIVNEIGSAIISSAPAGSIDTGHLNIVPGNILGSNEIETGMVFPDWDGDGKGTSWEAYFAYSQDQYKNSPATSTSLGHDGGYYWITDSGVWGENVKTGGASFGTLANPAIIVFAPEAGCPKPKGGTVVYGIVLFLSPAGCDMNGWGNVDIYGSLGFEGGINQLNANTRVFGFGSGFGAPTTINSPPIQASKLPGTWKDF